MNKPVNVCLWRKQYPANYQLLADNFEDITEGFEIQSPQKEFISWDLSLEELKKYASVKPRFSLLKGSYLSFKILREGFKDIREGFEIQSPDNILLLGMLLWKAFVTLFGFIKPNAITFLMMNEKITISE